MSTLANNDDPDKCRKLLHFIIVCTVCQDKIQSLGAEIHLNMSRNMRFPTIWYV